MYASTLEFSVGFCLVNLNFCLSIQFLESEVILDILYIQDQIIPCYVDGLMSV